MAEPAAPEGPRDRSSKSLRGRLAVGPSRRLQVLSVVSGVIFGAYVAEKLRAPLGFGANHELLFWVFFLIVMAILALLFMCAGVLLGRRHRDDDA